MDIYDITGETDLDWTISDIDEETDNERESDISDDSDFILKHFIVGRIG